MTNTNASYAVAYDYLTQRWIEGQFQPGVYFDLIADITIDPHKSIVFANQVLEDKRKVEDLIDRGICPKCHSNLTVKVYGMGYDDNPYEEQEIVCDSCNWKG